MRLGLQQGGEGEKDLQKEGAADSSLSCKPIAEAAWHASLVPREKPQGPAGQQRGRNRREKTLFQSYSQGHTDRNARRPGTHQQLRRAAFRQSQVRENIAPTMRTLLGLSSAMAQVLLDPRGCDGSSPAFTSPGKGPLQPPGQANASNVAAEAWPSSVTTSAAAAGSGDAGGGVPAPLLSSGPLDGDAPSAGDAELEESWSCRKCFKRVFLRTLFLEMALRR